MGENLGDFVTSNKDGLPTLDFEKLAKLSDEQFMRWHYGEMALYIKNHGGCSSMFPVP